ncbi:4Fe-4S dicluster domain-containing protein [Pseudanabaena sp. FACHB-1277]|uniref:Glycolate oxidase iron-sulfur subunit n=1 Tax=Pseudanabaena cinerea FACHB-1277 TaxID=2949581 RepID=A0A926UT59_9CYAN|nr:heterodisulfide reductase-related iron-sulfur binding cluster [Pseudanabaena cinerea]MBD2150662.1 4Fe-4S dicluster domain-containing protein [Pseudanabaena cinerea FACHB-1277]
MQISDKSSFDNISKNSQVNEWEISPRFDVKNPPKPELIDACVHCGFCLSTCPSYRVIGKETDSPRGRIYLMDGINEGDIPLSPAIAQHFDTCLGCLACVTTCPSGVQYDQLIEATRAQVERNYPRSLPEQVLRQFIFATFPYPNRLRVLLAPLLVYQKLGFQKLLRSLGWLEKYLPKQIAAMESILPALTPQAFQDSLPELIPAQGEKRYRVGMLLGCVQRIFLPEVNNATVRVLTANGCEVVIPKSQGCCGALTHHQGQESQTIALAKQTIDSFANLNLDALLINASGCGHTLKEYGHILQDDPEYAEKAKVFASKVKDVQEFLDQVGLTAKLHPLQEQTLAIAYQDACHMLHGQKISLEPRRLLRQIPNVQLRESVDASLCCGSAGIYNILQPEIGHELGQQKVTNLTDTGAELIASANVGCISQIRKHLDLQNRNTLLMHPMELLDYSIQGRKLSSYNASRSDSKRA